MDHVNGIAQVLQSLHTVFAAPDAADSSPGSNKLKVLAKQRSIAEGGGGEVGNSRLAAWLGMACWSSVGIVSSSNVLRGLVLVRCLSCILMDLSPLDELVSIHKVRFLGNLVPRTRSTIYPVVYGCLGR